MDRARRPSRWMWWARTVLTALVAVGCTLAFAAAYMSLMRYADAWLARDGMAHRLVRYVHGCGAIGMCWAALYSLLAGRCAPGDVGIGFLLGVTFPLGVLGCYVGWVRDRIKRDPTPGHAR